MNNVKIEQKGVNTRWMASPGTMTPSIRLTHVLWFLKFVYQSDKLILGENRD